MAARTASQWIGLALIYLSRAGTIADLSNADPRPTLNMAVAAIRMAQLILDGKSPDYAEEVWNAAGHTDSGPEPVDEN